MRFFVLIRLSLTFILLFFLYLISIFVPKKKNLWVFGAWSGKRYADNSRYFFEYVIKHRPDTHAVWLVKSKRTYKQVKSLGYPVYYKKSVIGIWLRMRSKYQFICAGLNDVCWHRFSFYNAKTVELWHGIPIKKVLMSDLVFKHSFERKIIKPVLYAATASSDYLYNLYQHDTFFGLAKHIIKAGQPRNDILAQYKHPPKKKILYAPTHRLTASESDLGAKGQMQYFPDPEILDQFERLGKETGYELVIRLHPYAEKYLDAILSADYKYIKKSVASDINEELLDCAILITDISSCMFDYAVLNRTILLCFPDYEQYRSQCRDWYMDPMTLLAPDYVFTAWSACVLALESMIQRDQLPKNAYHLAEKYNTYSLSGNSCQQVIDAL
jgi:CDP-glycerol glycerophosphotransferase (TagB/SpsB family)